LFVLVVAFSNDLFSQQNCDLKKDEAGIQVFLCETEDSPFKTINVNFIAKATLKEYAAGVLDIANYPKWQANILDPHVLINKSPSELIYYCEVDTPWPIDQRDLIFELKMSQDPATKVLTVTLKQLPDFIPKKDDIVRIPKAQSILTVTPLDEANVNVNYNIHVDIGGEIPAIIANLFAAQTPWQTFFNYRKRLADGKISGDEILFVENY